MIYTVDRYYKKALKRCENKNTVRRHYTYSTVENINNNNFNNLSLFLFSLTLAL